MSEVKRLLGFAGLLAWLVPGAVIWFISDGDCAGPMWCADGQWPLWTANLALAVWFAMWVVAIRLFVRRI